METTQTLNLYDTLSRSIKPLHASDGKRFRFYACGPTVYGPAHLGNFRTFVLQDVLRRALEVVGLHPLHVRNITDVDDKTIRQSQSQGQSLKAFTQHWRNRFEADCDRLNLLNVHVSPSAVDHISHQIHLIQQLIDKKHAYMTNDGVYYRVDSFPGYGQLAQLDLSALETQATNSAGHHNQADEYTKDQPIDFALWKFHKPEDGPNQWESPWGAGRPGWHIECSAMCQAHLGEQIDLHGGGIDLIFPHHVNEIAQSEAAFDQPFCRHWFHVAHLKVEGEKMSKSLGNLYTLDDLIQKGFEPPVVRYLLVSGHYRQPLNFTFDGLHAAGKALDRLSHFVLKLLNQAQESKASWANYIQLPFDIIGPFEPSWACLADDLNTPEAIGQLFLTVNRLEKKSHSPEEAKVILKSLAKIIYTLGLSFSLNTPAIMIPDDISELAQARWIAKIGKDFSTADRIRQELLQRGWQIIDQIGGQTYTIVPTREL